MAHKASAVISTIIPYAHAHWLASVSPFESNEVVEDVACSISALEVSFESSKYRIYFRFLIRLSLKNSKAQYLRSLVIRWKTLLFLLGVARTLVLLISVAVRDDFDNRGRLVWYPVWWGRGSGGALKAPPTGPGPEKKQGISTFLKFSVLLRLLGQQFHYTVDCNIGGNSRVVENNGLISMLIPLGGFQ